MITFSDRHLSIDLQSYQLRGLRLRAVETNPVMMMCWQCQQTDLLGQMRDSSQRLICCMKYCTLCDVPAPANTSSKQVRVIASEQRAASRSDSCF